MSKVECAFEVLGTPDAESIIILHGFFASSRNWRQVAEKLAVHYHVYSLDLRNHGASPHHPVMDYPAMVGDLLLFMDTHDLTKSHLLGHSMGGKIAMWFALNHPERVDKLIVADIAPVSYSHCFNNLIDALKELPLSDMSNRKQAEQWLAPHIPELSYRQFLLQNLILKEGAYCWRVNLDIFKSQAPNIISFPNAEHLSPYTGDVLFLGGSESKYIKAEAVSPLFPEATVSMLAGAGHWLHVQQPVEFLRQVEDFLALN